MLQELYPLMLVYVEHIHRPLTLPRKEFTIKRQVGLQLSTEPTPSPLVNCK